MRKIVLSIAALVLFATFVEAQPGIGITKTAPLSGKGSTADPLKITVCSSGSGYVSNGTSWVCDTAGGDITSVVAGTGISGGATSGAATVTLALTPQDCAAGSFFDANTATGVFTCVAEVGDISTVTTTANMGLTGGGTSGAVSVGLLSTCADGEVLVSGASGTTWTCAANTAGAFITAVSSDFTVTGTTLDLSTAVTAPGTLASAGNAELATTFDGGGSSGWLKVGRDTAATTNAENGFMVWPHGNGNIYVDFKTISTGSTVFRTGEGAAAGSTTTWLTVDSTAGDTAWAGAADFNAALTKFGSADGETYINDRLINFGYAQNAAYDGYINYVGYNNSTTQFRNLIIADGKNATVAMFGGSGKTLNVVGAVDFDSTLNVDGVITGNSDLVIANDSALGNTNADRVTKFGKTYYRGTTPSATAGCTVSGNDSRGTITCDDDATVVLTFSAAWDTNAPICVGNANATAVVKVSAASTTSVSFTTASTTIAGLHYHCDGWLAP